MVKRIAFIEPRVKHGVFLIQKNDRSPWETCAVVFLFMVADENRRPFVSRQLLLHDSILQAVLPPRKDSAGFLNI